MTATKQTFLNLAAYCDRMAVRYDKAGNVERFEKMVRAANHWRAVAAEYNA